ncbi:MAG: Mini-ribonuclease 3 [Erysipelotrichaceae bacterium]|nr:Mini-ribonuclease 3 [Erysipelotrichaceae bacterium]
MDVKEINATTLAYIGDAVMSLWVRELLIEQGWQKPKILQQKSVAWVSARAQAKIVIALLEEQFFTDEERAVIMRGRNAKCESHAKNADIMEYRMATGLEAVIGYLYLKQEAVRLEALWAEIQRIGERK